ncbi:hypothetical protein [Paraburkholderia terricola]|nr:hypothetical protein [Paraburkholderia terricola]
MSNTKQSNTLPANPKEPAKEKAQQQQNQQKAPQHQGGQRQP